MSFKLLEIRESEALWDYVIGNEKRVEGYSGGGEVGGGVIAGDEESGGEWEGRSIGGRKQVCPPREVTRANQCVDDVGELIFLNLRQCWRRWWSLCGGDWWWWWGHYGQRGWLGWWRGL